MALQPVKTFTSNFARGKVGPIILLCAKGSDDEIYVLEVDQNTGQLPVNATGATTTLGLGDPLLVPRAASVIGSPDVVETAGATGYKTFTRTAFRKSAANDASAMDSAEAVNLMGVPRYDYMSVSYPTSRTETYVYKVGGAGGTTVATVAIAYVDSTKVQISTVTRT